MTKFELHSIAKLFVYIFLLYIMWFIYIFGEKRIILYGSILVAAGLMISDLAQSHKSIREICPGAVSVNLVMCVYSLLFGFFVARDVSALTSAVKTYAAFSLVCIVICYISKEENGIDWLLNGLIIICIVEAVYVLTRGFYVYGYGYVLGPDHNPNTLGVNMDMGLFCLAYKSINNTKYNSKYILRYLIIAILFLYVIIGCGSRKCLIAGAIMCVLWLYPLFLSIWKKGNGNSRVLLILGIVVLAFGIFYCYKNMYMSSESYNRMQTLETESNDGKRVRYYRLAFEYFSEQPVFGIGLQQYRIWNPSHAYSHSTYAEALASWGVVGCILYFVPLLSAGFVALKQSLNKTSSYTPRIVFGLWVMELFLGIGQIWFYDIEHLIAWTVIALCIYEQKGTNQLTGRTCKYVKA